MLLKTEQKVSLDKLRDLKPQVILPQVVKGTAEVYKYEFKVELLPRETIAQRVCGELREAYESSWFRRMLSASELLALLSLAGWKVQATLGREPQEAGCLVIAAEDPKGAGCVEFIVLGEARVRDKDLGVDAPLKDVIEHLKNRENAKAFIIKYLLHNFESIIAQFRFDCDVKYREVI